MIKSFTNKYQFLSNFYNGDDLVIFYDGIWYSTVEHAYQAAKTTNQKLRKQISELITPQAAKKIGRALKKRKNWDNIKIGIMRTLLLEKFIGNDSLRKKLISTKFHTLVEGNTWKDAFWGVTKNGGRNELGKSLMWVRDKLI